MYGNYVPNDEAESDTSPTDFNLQDLIESSRRVRYSLIFYLSQPSNPVLQFEYQCAIHEWGWFIFLNYAFDQNNSVSVRIAVTEYIPTFLGWLFMFIFCSVQEERSHEVHDVHEASAMEYRLVQKNEYSV